MAVPLLPIFCLEEPGKVLLTRRNRQRAYAPPSLCHVNHALATGAGHTFAHNSIARDRFDFGKPHAVGKGAISFIESAEAYSSICGEATSVTENARRRSITRSPGTGRLNR